MALERFNTEKGQPWFTPNLLTDGSIGLFHFIAATFVIAWKKENGNEIPYPPSMLWHDGHPYALSDQGLAACFDANTGEQLW